MSEHIYLLTLCIFFGTILLVFGMRYLSAAQQAKSRLANEGAYQRIAEEAVTAQTQNGTALASMQTTLADIRMRLTSIEKILKEVE